ncbi:MAG: hypothetical protein RLZZ137_1387 [Cyanobacteriota bacterium]|jgi:MscS family membrane protein
MALALAGLLSLWLVLVPGLVPAGLAAPGVLRKVPGPSPAQTIDRFLDLTARAESAIRAAIREGVAEPGWFYSAAVNRRVAGAIDELEQATQALDLSHVPPALREMSGVATMLMLRSVLLYDLSQQPGLVLPDQQQVKRDHILSWTIPDTPISLAAIRDPGADGFHACRRCSSGDFLFTSYTLQQVAEDFEQIFRWSPELRHRYGADLFVYWALVPGGAVPPKLFFRLPPSVRHVLLQPIAGQSPLQWILLILGSLVLLLFMGWLLWRLRQLHRRFAAIEGPWIPGLALLTVGLASLLVAGWEWFAIQWINLIGPAEVAALVVSRVLQGLLQALLLYLLAEVVGQMLAVRSRSLLATVGVLGAPPAVSRRQGAGQILTLCRILGLLAAVMALIAMGRDLGVTSLTLLALSSVPALAISLGTQQLIRDVADGFSLLFDGQIKSGDACTIGTSKSGEIKGRIRSLGMRSMRIQQADGSILAIPNSQVADSVVVNHRFRSGTRLLWSLPLRGLEPATTAAQLAAVRSELEAMPQLQDSCVELVPDAGGFQLHVAGQWDVAISKADVLLLREQLLLRLLPILRELEQRDQERIS